MVLTYGAVRGNEGSNVTHHVPEESEDKMSRLIDADALMDSLSVDPIGCMGCPEPEFMEELSDIIDCAPTIETKEIKYYDEDEQVWKIGSVVVE